MISLGLDLGTTNIAVTAVDFPDGRIVRRASLPNRRIPTRDGYSFLQDPVAIGDSVEELLDGFGSGYRSIGLTGQMHGILYTDGEGRALSPLYTWLDRRGDVPVDGVVPSRQLLSRTGQTMPAGYGLLTHYANRMLGLVPEGAARIMGIGEYVASRLTGKPLEKTDPSCLFAYGAYDVATDTHHQVLLDEILPDGELSFLTASAPFELAGYSASGAAVSFPTGDNQAGFFGTVSDPSTSCHISIGTSGQLTVFSPAAVRLATMELRPFFGLGFLQVGATLCGGKAYEVLEKFLLSVLERAGVRGTSDDAVFAMMEAAAAEARHESPLEITTTFNGTRQDSELRGSITGISLDNFTLGNVVLGTVDGVVRELGDFRKDLGDLFRPIRKVVATGSAVRKNPLFEASIRRQFGLDVMIPGIEDGAGFGAALAAAVAAGGIALDERTGIIEEVLGRYDQHE